MLITTPYDVYIIGVMSCVCHRPLKSLGCHTPPSYPRCHCYNINDIYEIGLWREERLTLGAMLGERGFIEVLPFRERAAMVSSRQEGNLA